MKSVIVEGSIFTNRHDGSHLYILLTLHFS